MMIDALKLREDVKKIIKEFVDTIDNRNNRTWDNRVMLHQFYLIGILDEPFLTRDEEYKYFDLGKPKYHHLIESRLLNDRYYNKGTWDDLE